LWAPYKPPPLLKVLSNAIAVALHPVMHATGRKRSVRTLAFDVFDNVSPRYQWRYTEDEVRSMFLQAGYGDLRRTGTIGRVGTKVA
jgi:hypothetical protein